MKPPLKAKLFRGFADPSRLTVLEALQAGQHCVTDLVEGTGLSQPNLSMHLACLRDCGLVRAHRNGRFVYYQLANPAVAELLQTAERVVRRVAKQIEACPRYEVTKNSESKRARTHRVRRTRSG